MERNRVKNVVMGITAMAAAVFLIATYGTTLLASPFALVELNGPVVADSDGEMTAVVDTESRRVLIANAAGDLTGVVDCSTFDSPVESVTDVCVVDGIVYVAGIMTEPDSEIVEKDRIVLYDKGGNYRGTIYEHLGAGRETPSIKSIGDAEGGVVAAVEVLDESSDKGYGPILSDLQYVFVNEEELREVNFVDVGDVEIHAAACSLDEDFYAMLSMHGILIESMDGFSGVASNHVFTAIDVGPDKSVYACDDTSGALCRVGKDGAVREFAIGRGCSHVHVNSESVALCDRQGNTVTLCDTEGNSARSFASITPSPGFTLRMVAVWVCALYLAALAIALAIRSVRRRIASGETESFGPMLASVAVIAVVGLAIASLSFSSYENLERGRANEINAYADYLSANAYSLSDAMEKCNKRYAFRAEGESLRDIEAGYGEVIMKAGGLVFSAKYNGIGMYFVVYGKDEQGIYYFTDSENERITGSSAESSAGIDALRKAFESPYALDGDLMTGSARRDTTQYRLIPVVAPDGEHVAGVIEIGSKLRSFEGSIAADVAKRVLILLVMSLVVFLLYSELRACGRCLFSFRQIQQSNERDAIALLTRPFTFSVTMLSSIDSVMTVLIARDLLESSGMGGSSPLVAIPAVMLGFGMVIGQGLYAYTGSRVRLRPLVLSGATCMLLIAFATSAVVAYGNFWMYCAAKLAMSVPFGLLYTLGYSLPRLAEHDEVRKKAAGGVKRTDTSAAVLGTVLGGYAAQLLGNAWVYVIIAVACLPLLLLALGSMPKEVAPLEKRGKLSSAREGLAKFVKTPAVLAIALLIVFPATVAAGYTSFIFPLFSADLGLSKSEINSIFAIGQLVVYVCIANIERIEGNYGRWRVSTIALALMGVVFLLFAINTTLVWSLVVISIVGVLGKTANGWKAMWLHEASEAGLDSGVATGSMFAGRSLALMAQPFVLGALLGATDSFAVIVIGTLCLACALLFFLVTKNSGLVEMK